MPDAIENRARYAVTLILALALAGCGEYIEAEEQINAHGCKGHGEITDVSRDRSNEITILCEDGTVESYDGAYEGELPEP